MPGSGWKELGGPSPGLQSGVPPAVQGGDSSSQGGDIPSTVQQGSTQHPGSCFAVAAPHPRGIMDPYIPATAGLVLFTGMEFIPK